MSSTVSMPLTSSKLSSSFMLTHCASYMPDRQPKPSNHHHCPYQILPKPPKTPLNRPHAVPLRLCSSKPSKVISRASKVRPWCSRLSENIVRTSKPVNDVLSCPLRTRKEDRFFYGESIRGFDSRPRLFS